MFSEGASLATDGPARMNLTCWPSDHPHDHVTADNSSASDLLLHTDHDLVISDIGREPGAEDGLELLPRLLDLGYEGRVIFYIGEYEPRLGIPVGAHGVTDRPDELLHLVLDVLERRKL